VDDFHVYHNIPDAADAFEQFADQFGNRPLWSFSNFGDAQRTGHEPLVLSEFGNWGMPALPRAGEAEPDWFGDLGGWWSAWEGEPGYAAGVRQRFERFGLRAIWPDYAAFAQATQWHQYRSLKFEIEALRRQPAIQGYVITELSDIYWESNGLLDFERAPKAFHDRFARINAPDLVIPHLRRHAYWDDERVELGLAASHDSAADWSDARVEAYAAGERIYQADAHGMVRGEARTLPPAQWTLPQVECAAEVTLDLRAEFAGGSAANDVSVLALPAAYRRPEWGGALTVQMHARPGRDTTELARLLLETLGYRSARTLGAETDLLLTDAPTPEMLSWVCRGGAMLFLSALSAGTPFFWAQGRGGSYGGHWITSWSWLRPGVYRRVPTQSPLGLGFKDMTPTKAIVGLPSEDPAVQPDFLAGQIAGWVQHPAAHTVQLRYGKGRVVMTTYPLLDTLTWHPLAVAMLHDLIEHLASDACQPVLRGSYC